MAKKGGGGFIQVVLGFFLGIVTVAAGAFLYLQAGSPPVAVADKALPFEEFIVQVPMRARIGKELRQPLFGTSEDVYEGGAKVYREQCAGCHGTPGHDEPFAQMIYPNAPQLWKKHLQGGVVGVSDDEAGETYWKVSNGIRLTGMPSYNKVLSDTQMWQVSLLLKNANQELPEPVMRILTAK